MINREQIINRKYIDKEPVAFEYVLEGLQGPHGELQNLRVWFEKVKPEMYGLDESKPVYEVYTFIGDNIYKYIYQMMKSGMPLEMVVATGLATMQAAIKEEVQYKSLLDFLIGDLIKDM